MADTEEPLVVRESLRWHVRLVVLAGTAFLGVLVLVVVRGGGGWTSLWIGLFIVPGLIGVRAAQRGEWTLRVDADGLHWRDGSEPPWAGIAQIRVSGPGNVLTRLVGFGSYGLTVVTTAQADFARRAGTRPDGRVVPALTLTASPEEIIAAVHRFSPVPVVRTGRIQRSDRSRT